MYAWLAFTQWNWVIFAACILILLALDLGVFHKEAHEVSFKESLAWTLAWVVLAFGFMGYLAWSRGKVPATEFLTGYFLELSLSIDNVFVIVLIFSQFRVRGEYQHRILFWGVLGALVMRGTLIVLGVALINRFDWILYVFAAFIILTGIKMAASDHENSDPTQSRLLRWARRILPVSKENDGSHFTTHQEGKWMLTPLFLVLLLVEASDLVFALDSVPAIFGVTRDPFIVFSSNVFAIMGLRSLYFVLAGAVDLFRLLKFGIAIVLVFIGIKMLIDPHDKEPKWFQYDIPDLVSLVTVASIIAVSIVASIATAPKKSKAGTQID
jgi:tellurite resistance protein TerC